MSGPRARAFDPRSILGALQSHDVTCVMIGGLARVARGSDEVTTGVDICPSLLPTNLMHLDAALLDLDAIRTDGRTLMIAEGYLRGEPVIALSTVCGELKLVTTPAGVPRGYEALKVGASAEHLGNGLRPDIAATADLVAMCAALRRPEDLKRVPMLRRILELEAAPSQLVAAPAAPNPGVRPAPRLQPGDAHRIAGRARWSGPEPDTGIER